MAKTISNINRPASKATQATENTQEKDKPNHPISVYLNEVERAYMDHLSNNLGVSRHSLMQFAIRYFIAQHRAEKVKIQTKTKTVTEIENP